MEMPMISMGIPVFLDIVGNQKHAVVCVRRCQTRSRHKRTHPQLCEKLKSLSYTQKTKQLDIKKVKYAVPLSS